MVWWWSRGVMRSCGWWVGITPGSRRSKPSASGHRPPTRNPDMARVVVAGYMLRLPFAGNVLAFFQYVLGLSRLGHSVVYVEESGWPYSSYDVVTSSWVDFP